MLLNENWSNSKFKGCAGDLIIRSSMDPLCFSVKPFSPEMSMKALFQCVQTTAVTFYRVHQGYVGHWDEISVSSQILAKDQRILELTGNNCINAWKCRFRGCVSMWGKQRCQVLTRQRNVHNNKTIFLVLLDRFSSLKKQQNKEKCTGLIFGIIRRNGTGMEY